MNSLPGGTLAQTGQALVQTLGQALASRLDFTALFDQRGRMLKVHTALPALALIPERMVLREAVNAPLDEAFTLELDALSTSAHFELKSLIGEQITLELLLPSGSYRPIHGYVTRAAQLGADGGLARYRLSVSPWTAFLARRRDCYLFQDKDVRAILEEVFADHPSAHFRFDVSRSLLPRSRCTQYLESDAQFAARLLAEEGLAWHVEQLHGQAAADADAAGRARHVLVISDASDTAARADLGTLRFAAQHVVASQGQDTVTAFAATRHLQPNTVTLGSWDYKQLAGTSAAASSSRDAGEIGPLEQYRGAGAYRFANAAAAQARADADLLAFEAASKTFTGLSGVRALQAGASFALVDHPHFGANTTALNYRGALLASHQRADNAFVVSQVEHHCTNNLGSQAAKLLGTTELEHGTYKNRFSALPAAAQMLPRRRPRPTAPGSQTARVVGVERESVTTERGHRVKIQFDWQRGSSPNRGGMAHAGSVDQEGNAPGNEQSGTWVRVAQASAGANHGAVFLPRLGAQVLVQFIEGDIDRPVIAGQLYGGVQRPPYSAGVDSGMNHPGTISGVVSQALDGAGHNEWVLDDATGQLRMRLATSHAGSELSLGHLIQQAPGHQGAWRGAWRGSGFEAITQGWASVRAPKGLLVSTSARAGSYGSAQSTQMDAQEALAQVQGARDLGQRLSQAAAPAGAQPLSSHDEGQALHSLVQALDPKEDGKHAGAVNGQEATQATPGGRSPGEPVHAFARPHVLLDSPQTVALASEGDVLAQAGQDISRVTQGDQHEAAAHTLASVSGQTTSLYTHEGQLQIKAAAGPVSLRAHTDTLTMQAQQELVFISVNDEVTIQAKSKVELIGGDSSVVLDGGDITFSTPGVFEVKSSQHNFLGGGSGAASLQALPDGAQKIQNWIEVRGNYNDLEPLAGAKVRVEFAAGGSRTLTLDDNGFARAEGVPIGSAAMKILEIRAFDKSKLEAPTAGATASDWLSSLRSA